MPSAFEQWLDLSIGYLEQLRKSGRRFVVVNPPALEALQRCCTNSPKMAAPSRREETPTPVAPRPAEVDSPSARSVSPAFVVPDPIPAAEILTGAAKAVALEELRQRAMVCTKCPPLARARKSVVFGVGNLDSELMFIGEAPGADEDAAGEPFVGKAGQLLTRIIETMGLTRDGVYIANILKCRPDTPGMTTGNRKPTPDEMRTCSPYLQAQIDLIRPKVIVALGVTAVEGLLGRVVSINRLRGQWQTYRNIPMMPTFHPAYLLRNQALVEKRKIWEDMLQVMERLQMTITSRQRGFFQEQ
jgi:DNA polymerase